MPDNSFADTSSWVATRSGEHFDIDSRYLHRGVVVIDDIAHALSNIARYNGRGEYFYSVAEHSCIIADCLLASYIELQDNTSVERKFNQIAFNLYLYGLFHDGAEAYIGDITRAVKKLIKPHTNELELLEKKLEEKIIYQVRSELVLKYDFWLNLSSSISNKITEFDNRILYDECMVLFPPMIEDLCNTFSNAQSLSIEPRLLSNSEAKSQFLLRWEYLKSLKSLDDWVLPFLKTIVIGKPVLKAFKGSFECLKPLRG